MDYYINVNIAVALIYGFYHLALRRSAYFWANRAFLLSGLGLAFIIPALNLQPGSFSGLLPDLSFPDPVLQPAFSPVYEHAVNARPAPVSIVAEQAAASSFLSVWEWIVLAYCFISGLFLLKIFVFTHQLLQIYRKSRVIRYDGCRLVLLENSREPAFSFFSLIFINSTDLQRTDNWILRHEIIHVKQLHSLDILLSEIVKALLWINPFVYLYQRALRSVNEYVADAIVPEDEKSDYARLMYDYSFRNTPLSLKSSFFNKNILKRRITMLYQKKTRKMRVAYVLVIPFTALLLAFTTGESRKPVISLTGESHKPETAEPGTNQTASGLITVSGTVTDLMNHTIAGASIFVKGTPQGTSTDLKGNFELRNIPSDAELQFSMIGYQTELITLQNNRTVNIRLQRKRERLDNMVINGFISSKDEGKPEAKPEPSPAPEGTVYNFASIEKMPAFPGGKEKLISHIGRQFQYPAEARKKMVEGLVEVGFIVDEEGNVTHAEILRGIGSGCDEEALRVIKTLPKWEPGEQNGVKVAVYYVLPIKLNLN
ncbi:TonB family protein [Anseongella ginsenosidimutans]|uniref:TonB family protein n=1 Tax=Anseongella ginsenosidimutans TaxID=496056 RepID=A0A4R3KV86_9SPHI|nr:M56 family metallopeptidase [Anseongella ginsenosidimutans]QEC51512.1 TonB family protein [Anseongella ginsenosidimutans]TCS88824.1 TonB family protein [Anseongella ginsenosidimutans]